MSIEHEEMITCPKCGKTSSFTIWQSLNTMLNPEEKEKVVSGELFRFTCPACGYTAQVDYGFLYHQMEDEMMIYYVQDDEGYEQAYEFCTGKKTNGEESEFKVFEAYGDGMKDYLYRIVRSQNRLREKIRIFDDGKDDRIIELMKVFISVSIGKQHPELEEFELYYDGDKDSDAFTIITPDSAPMMVSVPPESYSGIIKDFSDRLPDIRDKEDLLINFDWAMRFITGEE